MSKQKKKPLPYNGRDENIVKIIKGATKAGVHKNQKKEANKMASREKISTFWEDKMADDWADTESAKIKCRMCGFPYNGYETHDEDEKAAMDCGYCSVSCMDYHHSKR